MPDTKRSLRENIWRAMQDAGVDRFPGAQGRIPNFKGAKEAAQQLETLDVWQEADILKCNPDSPQRQVRYRALKAGKTIYLAVPRLRDPKPFLELDPTLIDGGNEWRASSIKGGFEVGRQVALDDMPAIDMIVTGCVAVTRAGARLGKGGGYSDLEYALAREAGLVEETTPIVTTVHFIQIVPNGDIPMTDHDISLDWIATPDELIATERTYSRPAGILWNKLGDKRSEIPVLQSLADQR